MLLVLAGVDVVPVQLAGALAGPCHGQRPTIGALNDALEQEGNGGAGVVASGARADFQDGLHCLPGAGLNQRLVLTFEPFFLMS